MFPFDPPENIKKSLIISCFLGGDQKGTLGRKGLRYEKLQEKFSRNSSSRKGNPWVLWVYDLYEKLIMLVPKSHSLTSKLSVYCVLEGKTVPFRFRFIFRVKCIRKEQKIQPINSLKGSLPSLYTLSEFEQINQLLFILIRVYPFST